MKQVVLIAHNIRSALNVGSLFRTCDGLGASALYLTGYTPYPQMPGDKRLPHIAAKANRAITKTALGAEKSVAWEHFEELNGAIDHLRKQGYRIIALEQTPDAIPLDKVASSAKIALILGGEVDGLSQNELSFADAVIAIPMQGTKESFNVAVAAAIALFALTAEGGSK